MKTQQIPKVGVSALIFRGNKVLFGKRIAKLGRGTWGVVGGHAEFGETPEETVKREVKEEVAAGEPQLLEPENFERWEWFDIENLPGPLFKAAELTINSFKTGEVYNS